MVLSGRAIRVPGDRGQDCPPCLGVLLALEGASGSGPRVHLLREASRCPRLCLPSHGHGGQGALLLPWPGVGTPDPCYLLCGSWKGHL